MNFFLSFLHFLQIFLLLLAISYCFFFFFFLHPSLTISLHCYWASLVGHISPCLGKQPWGQGVRPHLGHPAQGPHGRGPQASTLQLDPQKQPTHPSCYGAGGSRWPGNSELSVSGGKQQKWSKCLQRTGGRNGLIMAPLKVSDGS